MSEPVWTKETLTLQMLTDLGGMLGHIDAREAIDPPALELVEAAKGGAAAFLRSELQDTYDLLTLAVIMLRAIRAATLEQQATERRQGAS